MSENVPVTIDRMDVLTAEAVALLEEYYKALEVVLQDGPEVMLRQLQDARSGMWVAYIEGVPAGCVVLKAGVPYPDTGECKRLFVRATFRRQGIAEKLMRALETAAGEADLHWLYLDTNDAFRSSVALYRRLGFEPCGRYNDNPQATLFFRKRLVAP